MKRCALAFAAASTFFAAMISPLYAWAQNAELAKPKIGLVMKEFDDNFQTLLREAASKEARKKGWKPVFGDGRSDQLRQNQLAIAMIQKDHVAALVVVPVDATATSEITKAAREAHVPLVYVNVKPAELLGEESGYVGSQDLIAGRLQGEYLAQRLNGTGNVAILVGQAASTAAIERTKGLREVLSHYAGLHVVAEEVGDWQRNKGLEITNAWLAQGKKIDAIVANNDEMAIGAVIALRKANRSPDSIFIMGVDATPDGLAQMDKGAMKGTVYQDATTQGQSGVDLAISLKLGTATINTIDVPFKLVTPQNYRDLLAY